MESLCFSKSVKRRWADQAAPSVCSKLWEPQRAHGSHDARVFHPRQRTGPGDESVFSLLPSEIFLSLPSELGGSRACPQPPLPLSQWRSVTYTSSSWGSFPAWEPHPPPHTHTYQLHRRVNRVVLCRCGILSNFYFPIHPFCFQNFLHYIYTNIIVKLVFLRWKTPSTKLNVKQNAKERICNIPES